MLAKDSTSTLLAIMEQIKLTLHPKKRANHTRLIGMVLLPGYVLLHAEQNKKRLQEIFAAHAFGDQQIDTHKYHVGEQTERNP